MSFGASPSDIFLVIKLVHGAYCKWRDASGEYAEVTSLLKNAKAVLHQIRNSKDKSNVLDAQGSEIGGVLQSCHSTVSTLDEIFEEYEDLSEVRSGVRSNWQRMKFGHKRDVLSKLTKQLSSHITILNSILATASLSTLDSQGTELAKILKYTKALYDGRSSRASLLSTWTEHSSDDLEDWRALRRQLIAEGFNGDIVRRHQASIQLYLQNVEKDKVLKDVQEHKKTTLNLDDEEEIDVSQFDNTSRETLAKSIGLSFATLCEYSDKIHAGRVDLLRYTGRQDRTKASHLWLTKRTLIVRNLETEVEEIIAIDGYEITYSSLDAARKRSIYGSNDLEKNMNGARESYQFQLVPSPAATQDNQEERGFHGADVVVIHRDQSISMSKPKIFSFVVSTSDERNIWLRKFLLARALVAQLEQHRHWTRNSVAGRYLAERDDKEFKATKINITPVKLISAQRLLLRPISSLF